MSRMLTRAERLRAIERMLFVSSEGLRVQDIAEKCGANRRTIYRDLDLLSVSGVPIWQEGGRFGIEREHYLTTVRLNFNEAIALYMAARLLARHSDEHNPHVVTALDKLATALPDPVSEHIARTAAYVRKRPVNDPYIQVLEAITLAWSLRRKVRLWYHSPRSGQVRQRDFAPYFIEPSGIGYACYAIGFDDWSGEMRTFKLERLERAQVLDQTYIIPDDFDPNQYLETSWGIMHGEEQVEVVLQFAPSVTSRVKESMWHPSQEIDDLKDGGCLFTVYVSEPKEMHPWIRSWGAEVEVISPPSLRQIIAEEAARMAALYGGIR
ncbi:MAG: WYL domain-containing transcriptional regulator [Anaerolineae bacterium]|nr:WYL domain-containing transcriptional regulator [Anaerolineae bacterium]